MPQEFDQAVLFPPPVASILPSPPEVPALPSVPSSSSSGLLPPISSDLLSPPVTTMPFTQASSPYQLQQQQSSVMTVATTSDATTSLASSGDSVGSLPDLFAEFVLHPMPASLVNSPPEK